MIQNKDEMIVLRRSDYGEADRIITMLTSERGKQSAIVKSARRPKSKLAAGVELFSVNEVSTITGKGELETITSARNKVFFGQILRDLEVTQTAYRLLGYTDKVFERGSGEQFFNKLKIGLELLNNPKMNDFVVETWLILQLSVEMGNSPDLLRDIEGNMLSSDDSYVLSIEDGGLSKRKGGNFSADSIKAWRVLLASDDAKFVKVKGIADAIEHTVLDAKKYVEYHLVS